MLDVGHVLYGSNNYGLDGPDSDKDYKVLLCPEAEDFYSYSKVEKNDVPEGFSPENYSPMDVRTFDRNLRAGNPNCIEMLWSKETEDLYLSLKVYMNKARYAYEQGYLVMVFSKFFSAVKGIVFNSFQRYGVNRKSASRAIFWLNFILKLTDDDFKITEQCWHREVARKMRFDENIPLPTYDYFEKLFASLEKQALCQAEEAYHNLSPNQLLIYKNMEKELQEQMKQIVFGNLVGELVEKGYW